ncbi:MAG: sigma-54-dependent Fis family transcriptional regulator [Candidatus Fermentibacteraceae bacterium]|nr:sigma-54-dependent Fis family transcriptional regulator [Candidatus Fermentibacteraceae bacterium]
MDNQLSIMIVDDEKPMLEWLSILLEQQGYSVTCFSDGREAVVEGRKNMPDILIVDVKMPGISGLEVLSRLREKSSELIGIVITAFSSVDSAVQAMRKGATDYLIKPFEVDQLLVAIEKALGEQKVRIENRELRKKIRSRFSIEGIIGKSKPIIDLLEEVRMVADKDSTVLISGESGTGKELIARAIHTISPRAEEPFLGVSCGSFSHSLLESELFGHLKGSFTGAHRDKEGLLVAAKGGTFFLDEVGELDRELQVKLLRALQEHQVLPVGGTKHIHFDARIIAATNANLKEMVDRDAFRPDLYYRLNVIPLHVPALRDRSSDIPILLDKFIENYSEETGETARVITEDAKEALMNYSWPGNVRELENVVERVCVMTRGSEITFDDLPDFIKNPAVTDAGIFADRASALKSTVPTEKTTPTLNEIEKAYTLYVLEHRARGQKRLAAKLLGINESTLYRRLEKYAKEKERENP